MVKEINAAIRKLDRMIYYVESNGERFGPYFEDDFLTDGQKARTIAEVIETLKGVKAECMKSGIKQ